MKSPGFAGVVTLVSHRTLPSWLDAGSSTPLICEIAGSAALFAGAVVTARSVDSACFGQLFAAVIAPVYRLALAKNFVRQFNHQVPE
jgi:hypothetical protein